MIEATRRCVERSVRLQNFRTRPVFANQRSNALSQELLVGSEVQMMARSLFEHPEWREALVFKGGTALSKVFGITDGFPKTLIYPYRQRHWEFQNRR